MEIKKVSDLRPVLFDQNIADNFVVYEVCRGEEKKGDLRRDLTLIHPRLLGWELAKTFGHYHRNNEAEMYEVVSGQALFLIQRYEGNPLIIKEIYLVEAGRGEKAVILPGFGMTTINAGDEDLLVGNWIKNDVQNDYELFQKAGGAAYYCLRGKDNQLTPVKNGHYQQIPELVRLKPKNLPRELENLEFLINPTNYQKFLTSENLYNKI